MASNIGSVGEFDVTKPKDWPTWKLRFKAWLAVNKINNDATWCHGDRTLIFYDLSSLPNLVQNYT